jgi:hemerythrin-like domain-containing protein
MHTGIFVKKHFLPGLILIGTGFLCFPGFLLGAEDNMKNQGEQSGQENIQPSPEKYKHNVKKHIQKAEDLLMDLMERAEKATGEERETLERTAVKINAELEHAKRIFSNFEGKDAEQWLRNKTELNAVMANLDVAYDQAIPYLRDKVRLLQEAIDRTGDALFYKEQKDLFNKMTESGLRLAEKAVQEGIQSEFVQEAISKLQKAREQFRLDNKDGAIEAARSAYLQLNSALKHYLDTESQS